LGKRVLLLNNRTLMRKMITKTFNNNGYNIVGEARNVAEAAAAYIKLKPDLVIIDAEMTYSHRKKAIELIYSLNAKAGIALLSILGPKVFIVDPLDSVSDDFTFSRLPEGHPLLIIEKEFSKSLSGYLDSLNYASLNMASQTG
jgi:DNA-binding NarL/FixJ family response regulator